MGAAQRIRVIFLREKLFCGTPLIRSASLPPVRLRPRPCSISNTKYYRVTRDHSPASGGRHVLPRGDFEKSMEQAGPCRRSVLPWGESLRYCRPGHNVIQFLLRRGRQGVRLALGCPTAAQSRGCAISGELPHRFGRSSPNKSCAEAEKGRKRMKVMYKIKGSALAGQDGWKAIRVVEAIYRSAESGRSVKL